MGGKSNEKNIIIKVILIVVVVRGSLNSFPMFTYIPEEKVCSYYPKEINIHIYKLWCVHFYRGILCGLKSIWQPHDRVWPRVISPSYPRHRSTKIQRRDKRQQQIKVCVVL